MDDWINYYIHFEDSDFATYFREGLTSNTDYVMEYGYSFLVMIFKLFSNNYFLFQFLCTLIQIVLLFRLFSRYITNFSLGCILFLIFGGTIMITNLVRNTIAILIFANCVPYIQERKFIPYLLGCIIAASLHTSALLFIPLYFFIHLPFSRKTFAIIAAVACAFFLLQGEWVMYFIDKIANLDYQIARKLITYTEGDLGGASKFSIGFMERLGTVALIYLLYDKLKQHHSGAIIFINLYLLYFCVQCFLCEFRMLADRLSFLFVISYWILWTYIPKVFEAKWLRQLFYSFVCLYAMLKMVLYTNKPIAKYENVLFGYQSYEQRAIIHEEYQGLIDDQINE